MEKRRNHDAGFKARVALEAVKGERTRHVARRPATGRVLRRQVARFCSAVDNQRPHTAHGGQPPAVVYFNTIQTDQQVQAVA